MIHASTVIAPALGITIIDVVLYDDQAVCSGVLRGQGRQHLGAAVFAVAYSIGLTCAIPTVLLTDIGIVGMLHSPSP